MNEKEISLVRQRYCEDRHIQNPPASLQLEHYRKDPSTGEHCFFVEEDGKETIVYPHVREDLSGLSSFRTLDIPVEYRNEYQNLHNKAFMADWIRRKSGHPVIDTDIQYLVVERNQVTVVISPDSMRFKNSFQLKRL